MRRTFDWWLGHALGVSGIGDHDGDDHGSDSGSDERYEGDHRPRIDDYQSANDDIDRESLRRDLFSPDNPGGVPDQSAYRPPDQFPDQFRDQYLDLSLEKSLDTSVGPSVEEPLKHPLEQSLQRPSHRRGGDRRGRGKVEGIPAEESGDQKKHTAEDEEAVGSSNTHYYFKLSSTLDKPNRFVDRSLPFFVPSPPRYLF